MEYSTLMMEYSTLKSEPDGQAFKGRKYSIR